MNGLSATFSGLRRASNDAAIELWLQTLDSSQHYIRAEGFAAMTQGAPVGLLAEILARWHTFAPPERDFVGQHISQFLPAIRTCLRKNNETLKANIYTLVLSQHAFSIIPDLVKIVETNIEGGTASAGRVLIRLTDLLAQQLEHPDFDDSVAISPKVVKQVLRSLTQSIRRFHIHRRLDVFIAFLAIAALDNSALSNLTQRSTCKGLEVAKTALRGKRSLDLPNRVLLRFLRCSSPPTFIREIWSKRSDKDFILGFLETIDRLPIATAQTVLRALDFPLWLSSPEFLSLRMTTSQQEGLGKLFQFSSVPERLTCHSVATSEARHTPSSQQPRGAYLMQGTTVVFQKLLLRLSAHRQPEVRVKAVQLLQDGSPRDEALRLQQVPDAPSPKQVANAQQSSQKYDMDGLIGSWHHLTAEERKRNLEIIKLTDDDLSEKIRHQLHKEEVESTLKGLEIALAMECCDLLETSLCELSAHPSPRVRSAVCEALATCPSEHVLSDLRQLLGDSEGQVRTAAKTALGILNRFPTQKGCQTEVQTQVSEASP